MSKTYYCTKMIDNSTICGERNIENFKPGRYNTCKSCRLKIMADYNKNKRDELREKKIQEIDPETNIRFVVEDTIKRVPLIEGKTIEENLNSLDEEIGEMSIKNCEYKERIEKLIYNLQKQIDELKNK